LNGYGKFIIRLGEMYEGNLENGTLEFENLKNF
jgi:hypothetical protein